jgi:hypothetical protein
VKIFRLVLYKWGSSDGEPKISQDLMETVKEQYLQDGDKNTLKMLAWQGPLKKFFLSITVH